MKLVWLLPLVAGCVLNRLNGTEQKLVIGQITQIMHDNRFEAPCGIQRSVAKACDEYPVCCVYRVTVEDSLGHRTYFITSWAKYSPGLQLGRRAWFNVTRRVVQQLGECSSYGCREENDWVVESDADWGYVP